MASILSDNFDIPVTKETLREYGFTRQYCGGPLGTTYKNGRPISTYHKNQVYYEFELDEGHYYCGHLYYFPEKFIGNARRLINTVENPRGYVYIVIPNYDEKPTYDRIFVQTMDDIEAAFALLKLSLEKANENTWSYNWDYSSTKSNLVQLKARQWGQSYRVNYPIFEKV